VSPAVDFTDEYGLSGRDLFRAGVDALTEARAGRALALRGMTSSAEVRWRQREVDPLLERLRRLVREQLELRRETFAPAALDAKRMETERVRWKVAAAVKRNAPTL
jgi:hypothetical protein